MSCRSFLKLIMKTQWLCGIILCKHLSHEFWVRTTCVWVMLVLFNRLGNILCFAFLPVSIRHSVKVDEMSFSPSLCLFCLSVPPAPCSCVSYHHDSRRIFIGQDNGAVVVSITLSAPEGQSDTVYPPRWMFPQKFHICYMLYSYTSIKNTSAGLILQHKYLRHVSEEFYLNKALFVFSMKFNVT